MLLSARTRRLPQSLAVDSYRIKDIPLITRWMPYLNKYDVISFHFTISALNPGDQSSLEARTFTLYCKGVVGNMLYLTDLDNSERYGHNIAEVTINGLGKLRLYS